MKAFLIILLIASIVVLGITLFFVTANIKLYSKKSKLLESSIELDPEIEKTINESYIKLYGDQVDISDSLEKKKALLLRASMRGVPPLIILLSILIIGSIVSLILI